MGQVIEFIIIIIILKNLQFHSFIFEKKKVNEVGYFIELELECSGEIHRFEDVRVSIIGCLI